MRPNTPVSITFGTLIHSGAEWFSSVVDDGPERVDDGPERVDDGPERVDDGPERVDDGLRRVDDGTECIFRFRNVWKTIDCVFREKQLQNNFGKT